ncbi:MAG: protease complex subunit PrcB family protein [Hahellaceae bacterium]|nr:protease complex subunit PrcB family protein [Hahellaceae bacterium]MCP5210939.1 protease complex subunit PrcB family protein [Hahellaceae bacterium]
MPGSTFFKNAVKFANATKLAKSVFLGSIVFIVVGCKEGGAEAHQKTRNALFSAPAEQPVMVPVIVAEYSQCRYQGDTPRVDVVREIDLATVLTPAFGQPLPEAPKLDAGRIGIWFFLGQRPTPGYRVSLNPEVAALEKGHLTLGINEIKPDPRLRIAQISTSPCVLIAINDISFIKLTVVGDVPGLPQGLALE